MNGRVRVLWLTKGLGRGGAEMLLVSLARALDPASVELTAGYVLPHKDALVEPLQRAGVSVHCLSSGGDKAGWLLQLRRLLVEGGFDVVHTHAPVVGTAARLLAPKGQTLVHTEHNVWGRYRRPTRWANAATIGRNAVVWAVSEGVAQSIQPRSWRGQHTNVEVMLHGIDPSEVRLGADARQGGLARLGLFEGPLTVGTVGNLTPKKDHDSLLRALVGLRQHVPDARLVIVGSGPREAHLRAKARELGIEDAVLLTGIRDDVPDLLPAFDLFAMSSLHEGLSIALVEALAAGLPVVATRVGGIPEVIVDERDGLLVPPSNADALADAMTRLARDPALRQRLADAAPTRAAAFGIQPAADALTTSYTELADGRPRKGVAAS